jgi:hypothetical protein
MTKRKSCKSLNPDSDNGLERQGVRTKINTEEAENPKTKSRRNY